MKKRSKYVPPRVLLQTHLMLETSLLANSKDLSMYFESMDIKVKEYGFTDAEASGESIINPLWD